MIISKTITQIRSQLDKLVDQKIAFIPTMGFLHEGHLALIKEAKKYADVIIVSIFVNKAQFNNASDYDNYPRDIDSDIKKLENSGATHIFIPNNVELLDKDLSYSIDPGSLHNCLCATTRPGHFAGVCLIIAKFFNIINPDFAIFGKKDFQQYLIIKKLSQDLNYKTKIIGIDPIREKSGLVLSSRNNRLDKKQIILANKIKPILDKIKEAILKNPNQITKILEFYHNKIYELGFAKIDYLEVRQEQNLALVRNYDKTIKSRIFIAVFIDQIRLIDNCPIN